ncbi:rod shape-determining protein [Aerococcaceae bacterium NML160702]|nr:rod shape-determining protein [Aerococcaceae bacterium NML171108]MCW6682001.1 rod shape-determining protein [Aerococcaceae bacterium NML160702]
MGWFKQQRLGIDLGSATTVICIENKGIALREPSIVALNQETAEIVAFGKEAEALVGRTSDTYQIVYPIQGSVIVNFSLAQKMLAHFIKQALHQAKAKPEVVLSVPSSISKLERRAVVDMLKSLGIHRAMIVEETFVTAIGADLDIAAPHGHLVMNIGAGTTDIAIISYGSMIDSITTQAAGNEINRMIIDKVREHYHIKISNDIAEQLKLTIGNAKYTHHDASDQMKVTGLHVVSGVPEDKTIHARIIAEAINEVIRHIVFATKRLLSEVPPEIAADIAEGGIVLAGGTALLKRIAERLHDEIGIPVHIVQSPLDCVAIGSVKMLKEMDSKSKLIEKKSR